MLPEHTAQDAEPKVCIVAVTPEDSSASLGAKGAPRPPGNLDGLQEWGREEPDVAAEAQTLAGLSQRRWALTAQWPASRGERQVTQHHGPEGSSHSKTP